MLRTEKW